MSFMYRENNKGPVDYGAGKECVLVIVFKCWDLPVFKLVGGYVLTA